MYKLRYYQQDAIDSVYKYFSTHKGNPVIAQPTGTGKSVVIAGLLKRVYNDYPQQRIMMLTHVKELIEQNFEKLISLWPTAPAGIYSAGLKRRDTDRKIIFAGIQSVAKKPDLFGHVDLIVIDECHRVSPNAETSYAKFIGHLLTVNPHLKVIGLSATPYRLGLGLLTQGSIFDDICYDNTDLKGFNKLLDEGFLSSLVPKHTNTQIDVDSVKLRGGEFEEKGLQQVTDIESITRAAVQEIMAQGQHRKHWLVFATGVEHCNHLVEMFESYGVTAAACHSKLTEQENAKAMMDFRAGRVRALVNNNKLTTGYDFPGIDLIAVLRPSNSASLWVQMLGRGTRPVYSEGMPLSTAQQRLAAIEAGPKRNCLVLDFAGNTARLGPINDPLIPDPKGKKKGGGMAPIRTCPECNTMCHASLTSCPECGAEFPRSVKISHTASANALVADGRPVVKVFKVDRVTYTLHRKAGRPPSIRVTHYSGIKRFTTYVCFEHGGGAGAMARRWWAARSKYPAPPTTDEAMGYLHKLPTPTHVRVWLNKKYPEIKAYSFTGGFEDEEISETG
jgi:DNA repair protein RadD